MTLVHISELCWINDNRQSQKKKKKKKKPTSHLPSQRHVVINTTAQGRLSENFSDGIVLRHFGNLIGSNGKSPKLMLSFSRLRWQSTARSGVWSGWRKQLCACVESNAQETLQSCLGFMDYLSSLGIPENFGDFLAAAFHASGTVHLLLPSCGAVFAQEMHSRERGWFLAFQDHAHFPEFLHVHLKLFAFLNQQFDQCIVVQVFEVGLGLQARNWCAL